MARMSSAGRRCARLGGIAQRDKNNRRNLNDYVAKENGFACRHGVRSWSERRGVGEMADRTTIRLVNGMVIGTVDLVDKREKDRPADEQQEKSNTYCCFRSLAQMLGLKNRRFQRADDRKRCQERSRSGPQFIPCGSVLCGPTAVHRRQRVCALRFLILKIGRPRACDLPAAHRTSRHGLWDVHRTWGHTV